MTVSPNFTGGGILCLNELSKRAAIDKADMLKYNIKVLISTVAKLYEQGDFEYKIGCNDKAFVHYMKGCSIMIEVIAKHPNLKENKKDPVYKELKAKTNDEFFNRLEEIRTKLEANEEKVEADEVKQAMDKFPSVEDIASSSMDGLCFLDSLPSVPKHMPSKTNNIPPRPTTLAATPPPPVHIKMPEPHPITNTLQIPPPTQFIFPNSVIVDPIQLADWIVKKRNRQQPNILLIDVRPREIYDQGCIKHTWITQIEPLILKQYISSDKIEERIYTNPDLEQQLFLSRNKFDLIVYYDQNSRNINSPPLSFLHEAIFEMEFRKTLGRAPMMLMGGFDAWREQIGERGIFRYNNDSNQSPEKKDKQCGVNDTANLIPVKVHYTFYDYFTGGASGAKQSMTISTERHVDVPPLRGPFSHTLYRPSTRTQPSPYTMPIPETTPLQESFETRYPDVEPNTSTSLKRQKTFIDNPFHGFTATSHQEFNAPPLPPKISIAAPPLPPKTPMSDAGRTAPVSSNALSQMGHVMIGTTGLKNLGNTCYMNSILQCLSGTIPFARYFLSGVFRQHINKENFLGTGGVVAENFAEMIRSMWSGNNSFISPVLFRQAIIEFAPQFRGSEQHDSQEFLTFILDGIHEDCNVVQKRPSPVPETPEEEARFEQLPDWQASALSWEKYLERNSSVVVSLFQGQYRSRLTCLTCQTTSTTYNSFMSLSLPIPAKRSGPSSVSIYQCLDYFVKEEILDQDNAWQCPQCKVPRRASKALTLSKLPDILLIHLKRFSFDGPFKDKLETTVETPLSGLDLTRYIPKTMFPPGQLPDRSTFDLYAVSNHFGTLSGGHYTACVRNGYKNEWHNFDDTRFSVCDESKVVSRAAYNLFYVRNTVK